MADFSNIPDYDSLPAVEGMPKGCAWGLFDRGGKKDVLGTLNLLTPSVVQAAAAEVKEGVSISLNWPIGAIKAPGFGRKGLTHNLISFIDSPFKAHGFDDEVEFNTQCSSQWDSLCHFHHQPSASAYNGAKPTVDTLSQGSPSQPSLEHWHSRGGLVGRGVLLDYVAYAAKNNISYSPFTNHKITTADLDAIAAAQGVEFRTGDILIVRSGFTEALTGVSAEEQAKLMGTHKAVGVEGTEAAAKWFWDRHFAAVAGDAIAFEVMPPAKDGVDGAGSITELVLHQYFLALFGMPIGELWDLKALAEHCAKSKRYTFLLTSVPLNVPGLIGSPPNALAIF